MDSDRWDNQNFLIFFWVLFLYLHIFAGNKCDFESLREVDQSEALAMAELVPEIVLVMETSAKDNTNVEQSFVELATELKVGTFV